jgi:hypothetical protein
MVRSKQLMPLRQPRPKRLANHPKSPSRPLPLVRIQCKALAIYRDGSIKAVEASKPSDATAASKPATTTAPIPITTETVPPTVSLPAPVQPSVVAQPTPLPSSPPPTATDVVTNGEAPPEFSLIPPGTKIPQQRPPPPAPVLGTQSSAYFGANLRDKGNSDIGAVVIQVLPGRSAERAGFKPGDVIITLDGQTVETSRQLADSVSRFSAGTQVNMLIVRNGRSQMLTVVLGMLPPK